MTALADGGLTRIGSGFAEKIEVLTPGFRMRITSAKANKLAREVEQIKAVHLDVAFLEYKEDAVCGALAEMWGLAPMTEQTKKLLVPPMAKAA